MQLILEMLDSRTDLKREWWLTMEGKRYVFPKNNLIQLTDKNLMTQWCLTMLELFIFEHETLSLIGAMGWLVNRQTSSIITHCIYCSWYRIPCVFKHKFMEMPIYFHSTPPHETNMTKKPTFLACQAIIQTTLVKTFDINTKLFLDRNIWMVAKSMASSVTEEVML